MASEGKHTDRFIPCTVPRPIGGGVFFRPVRSWHSATYAGEKLEIVRNDRSGCARKAGRGYTCNIPLTVTHRLYWHEAAPDKTISAFLSYPDGMGCPDEYFWEAYPMDDDRNEQRFFGPQAETEMEQAIVAALAKSKATAS